MQKLPVPPVPDLARIEGSTVDEAFAWLMEYYTEKRVPWNYLTGTKCIKVAYRGLHNLSQLIAGCDTEKNNQGRISNQEIVNLAAPLAFNRFTRVFDLPRRQFSFGRDLYAAYRVPFFFVEDGIVKLYFLQPRKSANLTYDQICMVATIHKRYLIDTEFFGQPADVEYVDVSSEAYSKDRSLKQYNLSELTLWSEKRLADRLTVISEAIEMIRSSDQIKPQRRTNRRPDADMPLFD